MSTATAKPKSAKKEGPAKPPSAAAPVEERPASTKTESRPLTNDAIGGAAGAVWSCLSADGPQTLPQLKKAIDASADTVVAAIGWLSREGKLHFEANGKAVTISLLP
jgi:hypothetical protein